MILHYYTFCTRLVQGTHLYQCNRKMFFFSLSLLPLPFSPPLHLLLFLPILSLSLILAWSCYIRFDPGFKNKTKQNQYFNYYDMNLFPCERWQISLRLSWLFLGQRYPQKESFPNLGRLWDALFRMLFWMIHSPWIHNRKMTFFFFSSFNNFTKHLCSEIPGVYFAQDWETTAGKANSLPFSEYVTQIICMTI